jgi:hypothetical protein
MKFAQFEYDKENGYYIPANKEAIAATAIISNKYPRIGDMVTLRSKGYDTRLTNGQPIGRTEFTA